MFFRRRRQERQALRDALPEVLQRMAVDPAGFGEEVVLAGDPRMETLIRRRLTAFDECCVHNLDRAGTCIGPVRKYERPRPLDGNGQPFGYSIQTRCCDGHAEYLALIDTGFVLVEP